MIGVRVWPTGSAGVDRMVQDRAWREALRRAQPGRDVAGHNADVSRTDPCFPASLANFAVALVSQEVPLSKKVVSCDSSASMASWVILQGRDGSVAEQDHRCSVNGRPPKIDGTVEPEILPTTQLKRALASL